MMYHLVIDHEGQRMKYSKFGTYAESLARTYKAQLISDYDIDRIINIMLEGADNGYEVWKLAEAQQEAQS